MMNSPGMERAIERYLGQVRASLRGVPRREVEDILRELHGHIAEHTASGRDVDAAIESLGDPSELARMYRTERVMTRAECAGSPFIILHGLWLLGRENPAARGVVALAAFG